MTIGMNNLGKNGRLGNQMFQYAALVGIAKQSGYDFVIPSDCDLVRGFGMLHCGERFGMIDGDLEVPDFVFQVVQHWLHVHETEH